MGVGVDYTGEQFIACVTDTNDKHKIANISTNLCKVQNGHNGILRGPLGGNWLMKKTCCEKACGRLPLKVLSSEMDQAESRLIR